MMEKIQIKTVEEKTSKNGAQYVLVDAYDKKRFSCWEADLFNTIKQNIGNWVEISTKAQGDYTLIMTVQETSPDAVRVEASEVTSKPLDTDRQTSIIAQCLVKSVLGQVDSSVGVKDAVDMYKEAVKLLNE